MRRQEWAINIARDDVVSGPWVVRSCALETDPAILCGVADGFGSSLVVASVMRSCRLGMETVIDGLTVWATAWAGRKFATAETRSRDGHGVVCVLALSTIARQRTQVTRRCFACALRVVTLPYFVRVCWIFARNCVLRVGVSTQHARRCFAWALRAVILWVCRVAIFRC